MKSSHHIPNQKIKFFAKSTVNSNSAHVLLLIVIASILSSCDPGTESYQWLLSQSGSGEIPGPDTELIEGTFALDTSNVRGAPDFLFDVEESIDLFAIVLDAENPAAGSLIQIREMSGSQTGRVIFQGVVHEEGELTGSYTINTVLNELLLSINYQGKTYQYDVSIIDITKINASVYVSLALTVIEIPEPPVPNQETLEDLVDECSIDNPTAPTATTSDEEEVAGVPDIEFPVFENTVITWTYEDADGNTATQMQNVIIEDTTAPVPDSESLEELSGECMLETPTAPTATDNCDGNIEGVSDIEFPVLESTTITWTFEDGSGNTSTQNQSVIIEDVTAPVPDLVSLADIIGGCGNAVDAVTAPTATDNCAGQIFGTADISFPIATIGTTAVTWTFDDGSGNTSTQSQNVVVRGNYEVEVDASICEGEVYTLPDGFQISEATTAITYVLTKGGCDSTVITTLTVFPIPQIDIGPEELWVCVGDPLSFDLESSEEVETYSITSGVGNSDNAPLEFDFEAIYDGFQVTATLTDINGCEAQDVVTLRNNSIVNMNQGVPVNNDPVLSFSTAFMPDNVDSWYWDFGDGTTLTDIESPTHTYLANGEYQACLIAINDCDSVSSCYTVNISAICPVIDNTLTNDEGVLMAHASGFSYQWKDCSSGLAISGATDQSFSPAESGSYLVEIGTELCKVVSECMDVTLEIPLVLDDWKQNIAVYPNPISDFVTIDRGSAPDPLIRILDVTGREIYRGVLKDQLTTIDLTEQASGIYIISLQKGDEHLVHRFMKK